MNKKYFYVIRGLTKIAYRIKGVGLGRLAEMVRRHAARVAPFEPFIINDFWGGFKFKCYVQEHMGGQIFFRGSYSGDQLKLLETLLHPDAVFVDVGANQGEFSVMAASRASRVISFEPVDEYRRRLEDNIALNGFRNVHIMPFALGDVEKDLPIYDAPGMFTDGTRHEGLPTLYASEKRPNVRETVRVRRLDDVLAELAVNRVDVMKLDIEGAEWSALRGAEKTLARFRPVLILEIARETCQSAGYEAEDFARWIISQGYKIERIAAGGVACPIQPEQLLDFQNIVAYPT